MRWGINDNAVNHHLSTDICLCEIAKCQDVSFGVNFIYLSGHRYGNRPVPRRIDSEEFRTILGLAEKISPEKAPLLTSWYLEDLNAVPPHFVLQPISSHFPGYSRLEDAKGHKAAAKEWSAVEEDLRGTLWRTVDTACELGTLSAERRESYRIGVTEQEVIKGILEVDNPQNSTCVYFRDLVGIKEAPITGSTSRFIDTVSSDSGPQIDQVCRKLLDSLRLRVEEKFNHQVRIFDLPWDPSADPFQPDPSYVSGLAQEVAADVIALVGANVAENERLRAQEREAGGQWPSLFEEVHHHAQLAVRNAEHFYGMAEVLKQLRGWLSDPRMQQLISVHGPAGSGKTALLSKVCLLAESWLGRDCVVIARFMGTSLQSNSLPALLASVCQQLSLAYAISLNPAKLQSLKSLTAYFPQLLKAVSQKGGRSRPLLIVLDGLESLFDVGEPRRLMWLPKRFPAYVNVLLSTQLAPEAVRYVLEDPGDFPSQLRIEALDAAAVRELCEQYLASKKRTLQPEQFGLLLEQASTDMTPQHLRILLDGAVLWPSYQEVKPSDLQGTLRGTINAFFHSLEYFHGPLLVKATLSYLSLGFHGVTTVELGDLVACNDEVLNEVFRFHDPPIQGWIRAPPTLQNRLLEDLRDYVGTASVHGRELVAWQHEVFREICLERYMPSPADVRATHSEMARLHLADAPVCRTITLSNIKRTKVIENANRLITLTGLSEANPRKLLCLWFHLASAGEAGLLKDKAVCSLPFLRAYIAAFTLQGAIQMLGACCKILEHEDPRELKEIEAVRDCLVFSFDVLEKDKKALGVQILGQLRGLTDEEGRPLSYLEALCQQCAAAEDKNVFFTFVPTAACFLSSQGALKLYRENVFNVFDMSDSGLYLLLYIGSIRNTKHLKLLDLEMMEMTVTIDLPDEPVDCRMNKAMTLVYVLTKDHLLVFDLTDGQKWCEYSTLISDKFRLNSCFDFSEDGEDVVLGGEDRVAILFNKGHKQGLEKLAFEWDRSLVVRSASKTPAVRFVTNEKLSLLVSVHVSRLENQLMFRVFNHESKEVLGSLELGVLPHQNAPPCSNRNLLQVDASRVLLALNDGAVYLIDILSAAVVWHHAEALNPTYLRTVRPHLRHAFVDRLRRRVLFATSYGEFTWLRVFDMEKGEFVFCQRSRKDLEPITAGCVFSQEDDPAGVRLALGGRGGHLEVGRMSGDFEDLSDPFQERAGQDALFRGHLRAVRFVMHRKEHLVSLGEDRLLKVWKVSQVSSDPSLQVRADNRSLQHENVSSVALTMDGRFVLTASLLIKQWRLEDGGLERSIAPFRTLQNGSEQRISDPRALSLVHDDRFLLFESKEQRILAVADFESGRCLRAIPKPTLWTCSQQKALVYAVTMREDSNFVFHMLRLPSFEPLLRKEFAAPHPGIEEVVRGLTPSKLEDFIVFHWGQKNAASFEAWALDLTDLSAPLSLLGCHDSNAQKNARGWRQNQEFKRVFCLQPLTSETFILGAQGDLPVWDLRSQECGVPFTPYMEAWLKHSVSVNLCKPNTKLPNRKGYDEKQFPKSPISAIAVSMDAGLVVSGAQDGSVIMWRHKEVGRIFEYDLVRSWGSRTILKAHEAEVTCLALSPKEDLLVSGSEDKFLCLFSVASGRLLHRVFVHMTPREAHVTPDSRFAMLECRNLAEQRLMVFVLSGSRSE